MRAPCLLVLLASLLCLPAGADDIDVYLDAGSGPRRLVLVIDWPGAEAAGRAATLPGAIDAALVAHAAMLATLPPPVRLDVSVLKAPTKACGAWPDCRDEDWALSPVRDVATAAGRADLAQDLAQLASATAATASTFRIDAAWTALGGLLGATGQAAYCAPPLIVNLLWSDVDPAVPLDSHLPGAVRPVFLVPATTAGLDHLATATAAEVIAVPAGESLAGPLSNLLAGGGARDALPLAVSVPAFTPQWPATGQEVLFPLFQPAASTPWPGNLKALKLVLGADGTPVIAAAPLRRPPRPGLDPADGGIDRRVLTFWTDPEAPDVQAFDPGLGEVAGADGRSIRRGGAGQTLPGVHGGAVGERNTDPGARQMYWLGGAAGAALAPLDATPESALALGLPGAGAMATSLDLLRWIRGQDVSDADADGDRSEPRAWLMAAVMHSQPALLDYGPRPGSGLPFGVSDRRVLVGSNDGLLRLIDISAWPDLARQGAESWAALPAPLLGLQRRLMSALPSTGHPYGVDGSPVIHREDGNRDGRLIEADGDRLWAFLSLRRGGEAIFALDLSDPDVPRLMWQLGPASPGFEPLALGFSTPRLAQVDLGEAAPRRVLIFGGGYHGGWQSGARLGKDAGGGADERGNALFVVDAASGALLWRGAGPPHTASAATAGVFHARGDMRHSIAAPVSVLDSDGNGLADRAYVVDTAGGVWRLDMPGPASAAASPVQVMADWQLRRVADLGGSGDQDRRFFHALDVGRTRDHLGDYEALLVISGDRARPTDTSVVDYAYLVKDRGAGAVVTHENLPDVGDSCRDPAARACIETDLSLGWRLRLSQAGEKGFSAPLLRSGTAYFSTYRPPQADERGCRSGIGEGAVYAVRLTEGAPALVSLLRPSTDSQASDSEPGERAAVVGSGLPGAVLPWREYLLLPGRGVGDQRLVRPEGPMRWRTHWRENGID